jgi:Uma2 family endonuclease
MSLADFDHAEVQEGYRYELGRGVIVVSAVPKRRHLAQFGALRDQLVAFKLAHPGRIHAIAGSGECKLLITDFGSERHPDLAVYKTSPPVEGDELWSIWIPELVIEIVSLGSELRDYTQKREEYLTFGVREYWIVDADKEEVLVLRRVGGRWRERVVKPPEIYRPAVLRGFELNCQLIFDAAKAAGA